MGVSPPSLQRTAPRSPRSCGHLSQPQDYGGAGDDGEEVTSGRVEVCGDPSELLELSDATFDMLALGVEVGLDRVLGGA